jgi:hypothetical protein
MVPQPIVLEAHARFGRVDLQACPLVDRLEKVRDAGWIGIPVTTAVVL